MQVRCSESSGSAPETREGAARDRKRQPSDAHDSQIPTSITAHPPGYIDKDNELIVGLQTDAPVKRAITPNGGFRMVIGALGPYGYEPDPRVVEAFTKFPRRGERRADRTALQTRRRRVPRLRGRRCPLRRHDGLAPGVYVNAMNVIHYMHDKYAYERLEMALHDYAPVRTMAFGRPASRSSPTASRPSRTPR